MPHVKAEFSVQRCCRILFLVLAVTQLGAQDQWSEILTVGGAFEYIDLGDARIDNGNILVGEYDDNYALAFALNMNYRF